MAYRSKIITLRKGEVLGKWHGRDAERLGLKGEVSRDDFIALAKNRLPGSITKENPNGEKLTVRDAEGRKVGYDFTFSVPKSVSVAFSLTKDEEILKAVQESVHETMQDMGKTDGHSGARQEWKEVLSEYR